MGDLQATVEFSVEFFKFFNVDLFQRGLYQVRCGLRVAPRIPVQVETSIPETSKTTAATATPNTQTNSNACNELNGISQQQHQGGKDIECTQFATASTSGCIINGAGASRVFQILYRNEEVNLRDIVHFRAHLLGKLKSNILTKPSNAGDGQFYFKNKHVPTYKCYKC